MYIRKQNNGGNDWLESREEWELELERGQNRGKRKKLEFDYDEDNDTSGIDDGLDVEWDDEDLAGLPDDKEPDFSWDDL